VLERPGALLEGPRVTADGAVLYRDVTGGGVYRDALITTVGALFRARSEIAGVPVADARI
jgi:hypothetical protein